MGIEPENTLSYPCFPCYSWSKIFSVEQDKGRIKSFQSPKSRIESIQNVALSFSVFTTFSTDELCHTGGSAEIVLAASRKASLLMFVLGGLTLFMGTCMLATIIAMPAGQFGQQMQQSAEATGQKMPFTAEQLRIMFITFLAVALMIAAGFIVLGVAVRRGGKTGTVIALVATALMLAFLAFAVVEHHRGCASGAGGPGRLWSCC